MSEPRLPDLARSFERHLRAENKSDRTVETYLEAVRLLEAFLAGRADIEAFLADLARPARLSEGTVRGAGAGAVAAR
jgi:Phage integrase, N-terminal SAM-like domain